MVSGTLDGHIGVLRIGSFLVPEITKALVDDAFQAISPASLVLIDLRDNGGGSSSSVSYTIERLIGPNVVIFTQRSRLGLDVATPSIINDYFPDEQNFGSSSDVVLVNDKHYLQWRTRPVAIKDPRPVYVLTNGSCASSCEIFAIALKEDLGATILGTKTSGEVLTAEAVRPLWKGYLALVPFADITSPNGNRYEGIGLRRDFEVPECDSKGSSDNCLKTALKYLEATQ